MDGLYDIIGDMEMTQTKNKSMSSSFKHAQLHKIFTMSVELADTIEETFESQAQYSKEFLSSLRKSTKEAKEGKLKQIDSLAQLK